MYVASICDTFYQNQTELGRARNWEIAKNMYIKHSKQYKAILFFGILVIFLYQMKLATLKGNNIVLSFRKDKLKHYAIPLLYVQLKRESYHCKAENVYFHYQ